MVGLSIMGAAAPMMLNMTLAPVMAQKKAQNFGLAESAAVLYVAQNQLATGRDDLTDPPEKCTRSGAGTAVNISCTFGQGDYVQTVTRAFVLRPPSPSGNNNNSDFKLEKPEGEYASWRPCPNDPSTTWYDPWGVNGYNDNFVETGYICIPGPAQGGLDPNDDMTTWLWDLRDQGFGFKRSAP